MEVDHTRGKLLDNRLLVSVGELYPLHVQYLVQTFVHELHHHCQVGSLDAGSVVPSGINEAHRSKRYHEFKHIEHT